VHVVLIGVIFSVRVRVCVRVYVLLSYIILKKEREMSLQHDEYACVIIALLVNSV